jgi:hypothetical protein
MAAILAPQPDLSDIDDSDNHMKLSPFAKEFQPTMEDPAVTVTGDDIHLCIFNDGVPSLVMASESDVTNLLHGISDNAIDENFPPTAQEAAELEDVEAFVEMMASFADQEAREERARVSFDHVKKRWETRRADGLIGRPRPAKHSVEPVNHNQPKLSSSNELVKSSEVHSQRMLLKHQKLHQKDLEFRNKHMDMGANKKGASSLGGHQRRPIQQPRKAN